MMDLNKHIAKNDNNKPFHSNGYAQVASGNRLGSTANISFNQRQQIDYNRRVIGGYNRSAIGSQHGALRARPVSSERTIMGLRPSLRQRNSLSAGPRHFSESQSRNYNPYS